MDPVVDKKVFPLRSLAWFSLFMLLLMALYEGTKQLLFPAISIWESHIGTILFTTTLSTAVAYFVLRRIGKQDQESLAEANRRKNIEEALETSEKRYRLLFEQIRDPIAIVTREGRFVDVNQAYLNLFGYSREELSEITAGSLWAQPMDRIRWQMVMSGSGFVADYECRLRKKDGKTTDMLLTSTQRTTASGEVLYQSILKDVSQRKKDEKVIQSSEELLRAFVAHTPAAVAMCDRQMRYLVYSRRWAEDFGLPKEDFTGRCHYDVFEVIPEHWKLQHQRCFRGEIVINEEEPFPRSNNTLDWVRRNLYPWRDREGEIGGLIMFVEVITQRKLVEAEKERLIGELKAALDQVKILRGLLPICASCKKIRDDNGYWNQIETYITKNSNAEFSHSICPECAEKLYPGLKVKA